MTASTFPSPEQVGRFYDRWSDLFLRSFGPTFQAGILKTGPAGIEDPAASAAELARRAGVKPGDRVLDAGCGVGGPAIAMAEAIPDVDVVGVTVSARQVELGAQLIAEAGASPRVEVVRADYHRLPFRDDAFDVAVFFESIGYTARTEAAVAEAARVVRPGGRVFVKDVFARPGRLSGDELAQLRRFDELWGLARSPRVDEMTTAFLEAGLTDVETAVLEDAGIDRFVGSLFAVDPRRGLVPSELGAAFLRSDVAAPIVFASVTGRVPVG